VGREGNKLIIRARAIHQSARHWCAGTDESAGSESHQDRPTLVQQQILYTGNQNKFRVSVTFTSVMNYVHDLLQFFRPFFLYFCPQLHIIILIFLNLWYLKIFMDCKILLPSNVVSS
jgi:hypothetical protein